MHHFLPPFSSPPRQEVGIDHWNEWDNRYGFLYSNRYGLREGDCEPAHVEINVKDYVVEDGGNNYTSRFKDIGKWVTNIDKEILSKYKGSSAASSWSQKARLENRGGRRDYFYRPQKGESELHVPSTSSPPLPGFIVPPVPDFGGDDLFPGPGAGVFPTRDDFGGSGSMLVGPNDPRFFGGVGREPHMPGGLPGVVPPGARFDPYGPPGVPGFEPIRFVRHPRRPGNGTHPDLEHFGNYSDFI